MNISIINTKEMHYEFDSYLRKSKNKISDGSAFVRNLIFWSVIAVIFTFIIDVIKNNIDWYSVILTSIFFILLIVLVLFYFAIFLRNAEPIAEGVFIGEHTYTFDDKGFVSSGDGYNCFYSWSAVLSIEASEKYIYLFLDRAAALYIPKHQLDDHQIFIQQITTFKEDFNNS